MCTLKSENSRLEYMPRSLCQGTRDAKSNMGILLPQPRSDKITPLPNPLIRMRYTWLLLIQGGWRIQVNAWAISWASLSLHSFNILDWFFKWLWVKTLRILNVKAIHFYISIINLSFPFSLIGIGNVTAS